MAPKLLTFPVNPRKHFAKSSPNSIMVRQMAAGEDIAVRRKKIRYRAWHRGTREMDLVLGPFADIHTGGMDDAELDRLEALMEEEDPHLLKWVMGQEVPPANVDLVFLDRVIADHKARIAK